MSKTTTSFVFSFFLALLLQTGGRDLVEARLIIKPEKAKAFYHVLCELKNKGTDTLIVLSMPFLLDGQSSRDKNKARPWPGNMFTANLLYYEEKGYHYAFVGDAEIRPTFQSFPELLILPPNGKLLLDLQLNKNQQAIFAKGSFGLSVSVTYALKNEFDRIVIAKRVQEEYRKALVFTKSHSIVVEDSLRTSRRTNNLISETIWSGMRYKCTSRKETMDR